MKQVIKNNGLHLDMLPINTWVMLPTSEDGYGEVKIVDVNESWVFVSDPNTTNVEIVEKDETDFYIVKQMPTVEHIPNLQDSNAMGIGYNSFYYIFANGFLSMHRSKKAAENWLQDAADDKDLLWQIETSKGILGIIEEITKH